MPAAWAGSHPPAAPERDAPSRAVGAPGLACGTPARVGDEHFVAGIEDGLHGQVIGMNTAMRNQDLALRVVRLPCIWRIAYEKRQLSGDGRP